MRRRRLFRAVGIAFGAFILALLCTNAAQAKIWTVNIQRSDFSPVSVTIAEGDTVKWVNTDTITHTSTSLTVGLWNSGNMGAGATFEHRFLVQGTFGYQCTIHFFQGTVTVSPTGANSETWGRVKKLYRDR